MREADAPGKPGSVRPAFRADPERLDRLTAGHMAPQPLA
jgi:hypothetical protein